MEHFPSTLPFLNPVSGTACGCSPIASQTDIPVHIALLWRPPAVMIPGSWYIAVSICFPVEQWYLNDVRAVRKLQIPVATDVKIVANDYNDNVE